MTNLSPKDKEKLFNEICEYPHIVSHKDAAMELANQYSEQIAIGFAEFILSNGIETDLRGKWIDFRVSPSKRHTSEELYNLYKQTLK